MALRWFSGERFWLNRIKSVYLDDDELTASERETQRESGMGVDMIVDISDARSGLTESVNSEALALEDLNDGTCSNCLLTTFDFPEVPWLLEALRLEQTEITVCSHPWPQKRTERAKVWEDLRPCKGAVLHFPGSPQLSQPGADADCAEPEEMCSVHSKLILLQFQDRLRVVISSANLQERFWEMNNEVVWVQDFPPRAADVKNLLDSEFARVLSHVVAQTLDQAPLNRREDWIGRLSGYEIQSCARLVASLPGKSVPTRALASGQLALRLYPAESEAIEQDSCLRRQEASWRLEDLALADASQKVLVAAERLKLKLGTVPLSELDTAPLEVFNLDTDESEGDTFCFARLVLNYDSETSGDHLEAAEVLAAIEVDYGLFALRQHLANEVWGQEREFVAITSAVSGLDEQWFRSLDECCGRPDAEGLDGPKVVVCPTPRIEYRGLDRYEKRLVHHSAPQRSPGRELVSNHSSFECMSKQFERFEASS